MFIFAHKAIKLIIVNLNDSHNEQIVSQKGKNFSISSPPWQCLHKNKLSSFLVAK